MLDHQDGESIRSGLVSLTDNGRALTARCYDCFRPQELCYCDSIPVVKNRTDVLILQHRRERFHPFNTARIVNRSLDRCELMVGHNQELDRWLNDLVLSPGVGLLFPGESARLLTECTTDEFPTQLVIPDGTWNHVRTLMRDVPRLQTLPRFRLQPSSPSRYQIRREPDAASISTLEATVEALQAIEPETDGLNALLAVMDRMVSNQLSHGTSRWRRNERRRRGMPNIPRSLAGDLSHIVVAYGEQERGGAIDSSPTNGFVPKPVHWTAIRLVSGERFECTVESPSLQNRDFLHLMRLSQQACDDAVSFDVFRQRWKEFVRPDDQVVVSHPGTAKLLESFQESRNPTVVLKSIHVPSLAGDTNQEIQSVLPAAMVVESSRASERLSAAVAFVRYLNDLHRSLSNR